MDLDKGESIDTVPINSPTGVTPAVRGDHVFFGTEGGQFFCIDWKKAKVVWSYQLATGGQAFRSSAAVTGELAIVGARDRRVYAFKQGTGAVAWQLPTKGKVDSSPVVVGGRAFVGSSDGHVYAIDLNNGKISWDYEAGGSFTGSAAVASNRLVIANDDGIVYCFGPKAKGS
ncbi:MAG: outer membrane protein assembly factor BamB [Pirellulaceae bacterium]